MTSTARTLTDADVEAIAEAVERRLRAANGRPKASAPTPITETMRETAERELARRGLLAPRRKR